MAGLPLFWKIPAVQEATPLPTLAQQGITLGMSWRKASKVAVPVWLLVCAIIVAINYAADLQLPLSNMLMGFAGAYLVTAVIIKDTADDIVKWRATYASKTDEQ